MTHKILFTVILFVFAAFASAIYAASGMGMGPPSNPCGVAPFPPCPVPIDGGISLLAGAGIALGARKMLKKK